MKLTIDTTLVRSATVCLGKFKKTSHSLLPLIEEALKYENVAINDLSEIEVATGPGSFTGLRVGLSIANMLSYLLNIPINNLPIGDWATPSYESSKFDVS